ncbi:FKBP-type peptidyl-prolyl cis-trans isomerase [Thermosulfuriphilus sp.]
MRKVKLGDTVSIHCTGRLEDGEVFENTEGGEPFEFEVGSPEIIPGLSEAVIGMSEGEEKEVVLPPEKAYGPRDERLIREIPRSALSEDIKPELGMVLGLVVETEAGQMQIPGQVVGLSEESFTLDLNPPLAGKTLHFKIRLVKIHEEPSMIIQP